MFKIEFEVEVVCEECGHEFETLVDVEPPVRINEGHL